MAYEASLKVKWDTQNAFDSVRREAFTAGIEQERAKAVKEIERLKVKAEQDRAKAEADKLATAKSIKALGVLTDQQLAEKFNLPLAVIEGL